MFLKTQTPSERLAVWRKVRQHQFDAVDDLLEQFKGIKLESRYLDYYTPSSWPNPFEIVNEGYFCQSGVTLILTATLIHQNFISNREICMSVISSNIDGISGLVLLDEEKVYNFLPGKVVTLRELEENATIFQVHKIDPDKIF